MAKTSSALVARREFKRHLLPGVPMKPILLLCEHCNTSIPSGMKWRCGSCGYENHRTEIYSFLNKCQKCGGEPKSYVCPNPKCDKVNFLDSDRDATHPARQTVEPQKPKPKMEPKAKKRQEHDARIEELERKIDLEKRAVLLTQIRASAKTKTEKTALEKIEDQLMQVVEETLNWDLAAPNVRTKLEGKYKDHPELMKRVDEIIKIALEERDASPVRRQPLT